MAAQSVARDQILRLNYELTELPTAQHKAGLAGLLLHLRSLEQRGVPDVPVTERLEPAGASIRFSRCGLQRLFDDLYAARRERILRRSRYRGKPPRGEIVVEQMRAGRIRREKRFVYEDLRPRAPVLAHWREQGEEDPWVRLWRDMLWGVLRAQPRTRVEYRNRAEGKAVGFVEDLWRSLLESQAPRGGGLTQSIAGSLFIGAQATNAERVAFLGRIEHNLLLHFWQWAAPVFVPRALDPGTGSWRHRGFLLVIPEVADLSGFTRDMEGYWRSLDVDLSGCRPTRSLIDLPVEGGLEFLHQLARQHPGTDDPPTGVHALDLYHHERQAHRVRQLSVERLLPDARSLGLYRRVRDRGANPLYRRLLIANLAQGEPWYHAAGSLFERYPMEFFLLHRESPRTRFFGADARNGFERTIRELETKEKTMEPTSQDETLQRIIYRLIRNYVDFRTRDRAAVGARRFDALTEAEKEKYREIKPKVASGAFLALRGRRGNDIAAYFTATFCAVGQFLTEEDFLLVAKALATFPEQVKDLSMLALSAQSWIARAQEQRPATNSAPEES